MAKAFCRQISIFFNSINILFVWNSVYRSWNWSKEISSSPTSETQFVHLLVAFSGHSIFVEWESIRNFFFFQKIVFQHIVCRSKRKIFVIMAIYRYSYPKQQIENVKKNVHFVYSLTNAVNLILPISSQNSKAYYL